MKKLSKLMLAGVCLYLTYSLFWPHTTPKYGNVPSTFRGVLELPQADMPTANLFHAVLALAHQYHLHTEQTISPDERRWHVQIFCADFPSGHLITTSGPDRILFQTMPYAFRDMQVFSSFNQSLLQLMQPHGKLRDVVNLPPLRPAELEEIGTDLKKISMRCGP